MDLVPPKKLVAAPSCLHQWRVPQFALKYPCNPPPPLGDCHLATVPPPSRRPSRANGGDCKGGGGKQFKTLWDCKSKFYTVPVQQ